MGESLGALARLVFDLGEATRRLGEAGVGDVPLVLAGLNVSIEARAPVAVDWDEALELVAAQGWAACEACGGEVGGAERRAARLGVREVLLGGGALVCTADARESGHTEHRLEVGGRDAAAVVASAASSAVGSVGGAIGAGSRRPRAIGIAIGASVISGAIGAGSRRPRAIGTPTGRVGNAGVPRHRRWVGSPLLAVALHAAKCSTRLPSSPRSQAPPRSPRRPPPAPSRTSSSVPAAAARRWPTASPRRAAT